MEAKKVNKLLRLVFILIDLSCIGAIIDFYLELFPNLSGLFNVFKINLFHLGDIKETVVAVPTWPVVLMIVTISVCLLCTGYIYKFVRSRVEAR